MAWRPYQKIREAEKSLNKKVYIMQDLSGPRVSDENGHHFGGKENVDAVTEKDIDDLHFWNTKQCRLYCNVFCWWGKRCSENKKIIQEKNGTQKIISKIERRVAVENLESIINESDGVIVARGDLGNEYPLEEIPFIQHKIINKANELDKPVILATQMLILW